MDQPIPVTIITGFLGAGKTTFLNHLIEQHPDTKFAIIENEFGDINIDQELVIGADEGIFEMSNGCICCTLNEELIDTLAKLIHSGKPFDHLVIETTGMAEPDGVAAAFVSSEEIQAYFQLNATVCMVDAAHFADTLEDREEALKQLTFADLVVLNKKSAVQASYLEELRQQIQGLNPFAQILETDYGKVNDTILALQAYRPKRTEDSIIALDDHSHHDHSHSHHHHHHLGDVKAHSFTFTEPFDFLKFMQWSKVLLMFQRKNIYRIKGIINFAMHDQKMIFQSVQAASSFQKGSLWEEDQPRVSRLVIIGKGLQRDRLEKSIRTCLERPRVT